MRTKPFQCILSFLLALLETVHGGNAPTAECTAQVWVRAPDLTPNVIVHGDARVKISVECPTIENVALGLRFKERSFVKALRSREDVTRLNPELPRYDPSSTSPWALRPPHFANKSVEEAYEETITNKNLWIVREEERLVFETAQPINMGNSNHGTLRDVVQDFSILVPSTNFPPVLDLKRAVFPFHMEREIVIVQWIYEYFAQISFSNGTMKEVSAGYTAFQPLHDPAYASQEPTLTTVVGLKPFGDMNEKNIANYSIKINADSGLTFVAGTKNHVATAIVTRSGFARTFSAPLKVFSCVMPDSSSTWAAEYDWSNLYPGLQPTPTSVLHAISDGRKPTFNMLNPQCSRQHNSGVSIIIPNSTSDEIQASKVVTTTSTAFTISVSVDDVHIPTFETYYQTLINSLTITLETTRGENEDVDPDDPSGEHNSGWGPQFEDDEEAWVPWEKKGMTQDTRWQSYSGHVPAVVNPTREGVSSTSQVCPHATMDMLGQATLSDEMSCGRHSLIHYLDEGARGPIFVERNAVHQLLSEHPAERELRAPILKPVVTSPPEGDERTYRYYHRSNPPKSLIYVGETWAKKVVNKN